MYKNVPTTPDNNPVSFCVLLFPIGTVSLYIFFQNNWYLLFQVLQKNISQDTLFSILQQ